MIIKNRFNRFKNDIKLPGMLLINLFQKKQTNTKLRLFLTDNDIKITDKKTIANKFNNYFTNIGQSITQRIKYKGSQKYSYYWNKNVTSTFTFEHIDEKTVRKTINNLPTKYSCGFDGISTNLHKIIEPVILKSLSLNKPSFILWCIPW